MNALPLNRILAALLAGGALLLTAFAALSISPGGSSLRAVVYGPPETTLTQVPPLWSNDKTPAYSFVSNQTGAKFQCRWGNDAWFVCTSPWQAANPRPEGQSVFSVRATNGGRIDPTPAIHFVIIDTIKPKVAISGPEETFNRQPQMKIVSNEDNVTFSCSLDDRPWQPCASSWVPQAPLAFGKHVLKARATDRASNTSFSPDTKTFTIRRDVTPPNTSIKGPAVSKDRRPSFNLDSNEKGVSFQCSLNGGPWFSCASSWRPASPLPLGQHRLRARAIDDADNIDPNPASHSFKIVK